MTTSPPDGAPFFNCIVPAKHGAAALIEGATLGGGMDALGVAQDKGQHVPPFIDENGIEDGGASRLGKETLDVLDGGHWWALVAVFSWCGVFYREIVGLFRARTRGRSSRFGSGIR